MGQPFWKYQPARNVRLAPDVYTTIGQPVFFTVRAFHGREPFADATRAAILVDCIRAQRLKSGCEVIAYCVMPDHFHVVVTPAKEDSSSLSYVDRLKGWSGRCLRLQGWTGKLWQPRSYDHAIRTEEDLAEIVAYILGNPVRAGLVGRWDEYAWSGMPEAVFGDGG